MVGGGKIILVCGYCAAGKSTFSQTLAQRINIPCFNKDIIKELMGEGLGVEHKNTFPKLSVVTFDLMLHIAERFLQAGQACVLESNFKPAESERIKKLLTQYNGTCLTFLFKGDLDILYHRYVDRENTEARHWIHSPAVTKDAFINGMKPLAETAIGECVLVDGTDFTLIPYEYLYQQAERFIT